MSEEVRKRYSMTRRIRSQVPGQKLRSASYRGHFKKTALPRLSAVPRPALTPETRLIDVHVLKGIWPCTDANRKPHFTIRTSSLPIWSKVMKIASRLGEYLMK